MSPLPLIGFLPFGWPATLAGILLIFLSSQLVYRLLLHPLSSIPGPKLAASTSLYRMYFDVWKDGHFLHHLRYLHSIYGPVVRCGPNSVHFDSLQAYQELYRTGTMLLKDPHLYKAFDLEGSSFAFVDPSEHKTRREIMNPFFSAKAVANLAPKVIQVKVDLLAERLLSVARDPETRNEPFNLRFAFRAFALDVITAYCFGWSIGCLSYPPPSLDSSPKAKLNLRHPVLLGVNVYLSHLWIFKWFPIVRFLGANLPAFVVKRLDPVTRSGAELSWAMSEQVEEHMQAVKEGTDGKLKDVDHELIFHRLLTVGHDENSKAHEKPLSKWSIVQESKLMIEAGSETVGGTVYSGMYIAYSRPHILKMLREEIDQAWEEEGGSPSLQKLERLPFLTAFIKETLRIVPNVETPLPRIAQHDMLIGGVHIPAKTVIAMSTTFVHRNASIFPDPDDFKPDRWLTHDAKDGGRLEQWLTPFSKGSRICIGERLAWAELYLAYGNILHKIDFDIHDTTLEDVTEFREIFVPQLTGKDFHAYVKERVV